VSKSKSFLLVFSLFLISGFAMAEGTKEIMPNPEHIGRIVFDTEFGNFAIFNCKVDERLNIRINDVGEKIYYGMGLSYRTEYFGQEVSNDIYYRVIDPDGKILIDSVLQPKSGPGFIANYQQAISGPKPINPLGYDPLFLVCETVGDYYIEFYFSEAELGDRREFEYFDITVTGSDNKSIPGRVWSKSWMFTVSRDGGDPYFNPFFAKVYILTDDGFVSSVDFNGMKPYVFSHFANDFGVNNTGNPLIDQKSVPYKVENPQFKIFLNNPDTVCFPSGVYSNFVAPSTIEGEEPPFCINVASALDGSAEILIELNGTPGYQADSKDVLLVQKVDAGSNCIYWDGLNGKGKLVDRCGGTINLFVTLTGGLTHLSLYDVETCEYGIVVEWVRPIKEPMYPALHWDDSDFPYYLSSPSNGCVGDTGCRVFGYFAGDSNTMNTWWYSKTKSIDTLQLYEASVKVGDVLINNQTCSNKADGSIEIIPDGEFSPFLYSFGTRSYQSSPQFDSLVSGEYTIRILDDRNCVGSKKISVGLNTTILADFEAETVWDYDDFKFDFTGQGSSYFEWDFGDGTTTRVQNPFHHYNYDTTYRVKLIAESGPPDFCIDSVIKYIEVLSPLKLYAPNAFTPNGDNLNDTFEVTGYGLYSFELYIFSSNGTQVFYSNNLENQWDGRWNSEMCEYGVYGYVVRAKDKFGNDYQKRGTVTLLR